MTDQGGHWRWNVNPTWEHFSSLCQESNEAILAPNDFFKYHHIKACLYFGIGSIESFLNESMRKKLHSEDIEEEKIYKKLHFEGFREKVKKWPSVLAQQSITIPEEVVELINDYGDLRGEVTHPKARNHSIYKLLDNVHISNMPIIVAEFIVRVLEACRQTFPYWLLGWNYIGMNGDENWPALINNQQFMYSLYSFGFKVPIPLADEMSKWEAQHMSTLHGFQSLSVNLAKLSRCELKDKRFPKKPRLCKKWWDKDHKKFCGVEF